MDKGMDVTNHMSPVDDEMYEVIMKNFATDLFQIEQDQKELDRKALEDQRRLEEEERIQKAEEVRAAREDEERQRREAEEQRKVEIEDAKRKVHQGKLDAIEQVKRDIEEAKNLKLAEDQAEKERTELDKAKAD
jgi:hypothetical protein